MSDLARSTAARSIRLARSPRTGAALILTVLMLALLLAGMVVVTFALTLTTRVSAADGHDTVSAQLAAESGLAHARAHLASVRRALDAVSVPDEVAAPRVDALVTRFCGGQPWRATSDGARCEATDEPRDEAFDLFSAFVPAAAYPDGEDATTFWRDVRLGRERDVVLDDASNTVRRARWTVALRPVRAERTNDGAYRLYVRVAALDGVGTIERDGRGVARRRVRADFTDDLVLTFARRSLHRFAVLRDAPAPSNEAAPFRAGDRFGGPVHSNAAPSFEVTPSAFARFGGPFSTSSPTASVAGDVGCASLLACPKMFVVPPTFDAPAVIFPPSDVVPADLGVAPALPGARLIPSGLIVEDDVDRLALSVRSGRQVIDVTQGNVTVSLRARDDGAWDVWRGGALTESRVAFSGVVFVRGHVRDVRGDGSSAADVAAASRVSIVALGGVAVADDVTLTHDPLATPEATNRLGLVALGGDVAISPSRAGDLTLHAAIAVLAEGRGLATTSCATIAACRAPSAPTLRLLGSLAERSPRPFALRLDVTHDGRAAPPAFPREARWTIDAAALAATGTWRQAP